MMENYSYDLHHKLNKKDRDPQRDPGGCEMIISKGDVFCFKFAARENSLEEYGF